MGILACNSGKALRTGGRSLEYPGLFKIWQHQKLAGLYLPGISILLLLKCFRLQSIAPLFLCRNDAIVLAPPCCSIPDQLDETKIPVDLIVGGPRVRVWWISLEDVQIAEQMYWPFYDINVRRSAPPRPRHTPGPSSFYGLMSPHTPAHVPRLCGSPLEGVCGVGGGSGLPEGNVRHRNNHHGLELRTKKTQISVKFYLTFRQIKPLSLLF